MNVDGFIGDGALLGESRDPLRREATLRRLAAPFARRPRQMTARSQACTDIPLVMNRVSRNGFAGEVPVAGRGFQDSGFRATTMSIFPGNPRGGERRETADREPIQGANPDNASAAFDPALEFRP